MEARTFSLTEVDGVAGDLLARARERNTHVIALSGDLGAGKTTLAQAIARHVGVSGDVTSPTFVVMKSYGTTDRTWPRFVHVDAYRIEHPDELRVLDFDATVAKAENLILVEWPERVAGSLPHDALEVSLAHTTDGRRTISYG